MSLFLSDAVSVQAEFDGGRELKGLMSFALRKGLAFEADPPPPREIL